MIKYPLTNCNECALSCQFGQGYSGDTDSADIMIIGECPINNDDRGNRLFMDELIKAGFPMSRTVITNTILCKPINKKTPDKDIIKNCAVNLEAILNYVKPKFVIVTGNVPLKALTGNSGITKHRGTMIDVGHSKIFPIYHPEYILRNMGVLNIFRSDIENIVNNINGMKQDIVLLKNTLITSIPLFNSMIKKIYSVGQVAIDIKTTGLYHWRNKIRCIQFSFDDNSSWFLPLLEHEEQLKIPKGNPIVDQIVDKEKEIVDRETTLYKYWSEEDRLFIKQELRGILSDDSIMKSGQNFKFDRKFLEYFLWKNDYSQDLIKNVFFDTMLASYILDENTPNDLKTNIYMHFDDLRGYASELQGKINSNDEEENDFTKVKLETLFVYGCGDAIGTYRLTNKFIELISKDQHSSELFKLFFELYMPMHNIYTWMERVGVGLDVDRVNEVIKKYTIEGQKLEDDILTTINRPIDSEIREPLKAKYPSDTEKKLEARIKKLKFNLNSPTQLSELLFGEMKLPVLKRTDKGSPSTDQETLKELANENPFCRKIVQFKNKGKMISTYLKGSLRFTEFEGTIVPEFPMLHYTYNLIGTVTGRLSCKQFPIQTIPRNVDIRSIICAPPGYYLVEWDLSQIELRLAAWYSQDQTMLDEFKNHIDIHVETLKFMKGLSDEGIEKMKADDIANFKEMRKRAKLYNFGGLYKGGAETLASSINEKLEEDEERVTTADAQKHLDYFFSKYSGLNGYYDKIATLAARNKYVLSCFGRKRRLPALALPDTQENRREREEAIRQAINSPIQGTGSDLTQMALIEFTKWIKDNNKKTVPCFTVHDSIIAMVPEDELKESIIKCKELMETERSPIMRSSIYIKAEASVFRNWKIPLADVELEKHGITKEILEG